MVHWSCHLPTGDNTGTSCLSRGRVWTPQSGRRERHGSVRATTHRRMFQERQVCGHKGWSPSACLARSNSEFSFRKLRPQSPSSRFTQLHWPLYKFTVRLYSNPVFFIFYLGISFCDRSHLSFLSPTCLESSDVPGGSLTFKFHTSACDWDDDVYMGIVRKLEDVVNFGKSISEYAFSLQLLSMLTS